MTAVRRTRAMALLWRAHSALYRLSGGRVGSSVGALPVLLLTVRGRRSGEPRTVALNYLEHQGGYVVFASHAGEDREPPWMLNLRAAGDVEVQIGPRRLRVRARELDGEERDRLYAQVSAAEPGYAEYARRTTRRIAVVLLTPA